MRSGIALPAFIIAACCIVALAFTDKPVRALECSVVVQGATGEATNTLTFVAYDVESWDMNGRVLYVSTVEDGERFAWERAVVDGETCRDVAQETQP